MTLFPGLGDLTLCLAAEIDRHAADDLTGGDPDDAADQRRNSSAVGLMPRLSSARRMGPGREVGIDPIDRVRRARTVGGVGKRSDALYSASADVRQVINSRWRIRSVTTPGWADALG
jgi:hypothetical protein